MTVLWLPPLDAGAARWLALARVAIQSDDTAPSGSSSERGLLRMFAPTRQGKAKASAVAVVAVIEALAAAKPALSVLIAAAFAGSIPVLRLGSPQQKKLWLTPTAEEVLPPLLAGSKDAVDSAAEFTASSDGKNWLLQGKGHWQGSTHASTALVLFATHPQKRVSQLLSAFLIPFDTVGLTREVLEASNGQTHAGSLSLDTRVAAECLLGTQGSAYAAMAEALAVRRIAAAAQSMSVAIHAYDQTCLLASLHRGDGASHAALKLANCATAISAARMMLYQVAQATENGENVSLLSAMAMLSANECTDQMLSVSLQIASSMSSTDPMRLQSLIRARQLHQVTAGTREAQVLLLSEAIISPVSKTTTGDSSNMANHSPARQQTGRITEILDAAADAFTQQSYDATTLDYIGDVVGVSKGSIYYHYRSKADLFVAVYRRAMEMNLETVEPISAQTGVRAIDRLYRMAYAHSLQVMKHLSYQRLAVQGLEAHLMGRVTDEQRDGLNEVIGIRDRYEELFVQAIKRSVEAGELPQQDPKLAVKPLFGAINHTAMWYQPRPGETAADRERIATHLATFVISGLTQSHRIFPEAEISSPSTSETTEL